MKVKLYIEKILKIGIGVFGFALISAAAAAQDGAGIHDTRQWGGFEMAKEGFKDAVDSAQWLRARAQGGLKMTRDDLHNAREAYREMLKNAPARLISSGVASWLEQAEERYAAAKEIAELYRDIAKLQTQQGVDKLTYAAQNLKYAHLSFDRETGHYRGTESLDRETEHSMFEALGENGSLSKGASNEKGARGVESKTAHFKLSEALWKSSEVASEHGASEFIMDKLNVFENGATFQFAKEDYFDDFKEKYENGTENDVAKDILRDNNNKESKIERIALAAERSERRRAEKEDRKAERNDDKVEKAEVKEEKKAEKEEQKAEDKAEKDDNDKKGKDNSDADGGKKGK